MTREGYYSFVWCGRGPHPPRGPFVSLSAAVAAASAFHVRHGANAARFLAAGSVRLAGPFATRRAAAAADIGDDVPMRDALGLAASLVYDGHAQN